MAGGGSFTISGLAEFQETMRKSPQAVKTGCSRGLKKAGQFTLNQAKSIALMDTGNLRDSMKLDSVQTSGTDNFVVLHSDAYKGSFNYAYYLHEVKGSVKNPTTPGTEPRHLALTLSKYEGTLVEMMEQSVLSELMKRGW